MRRKIALILIITGFLFAGWHGYLWVLGTSSGREHIGEKDIIVAADKENRISLSTPDKATSDKEKIVEANALAKEELSPPEIDKKKETKKEPRVRDYKEYKKGQEVGWLLIPALDMKYAIYWGTDEDTLIKGVGYHTGIFTTPPDGLGHTVLSGHRDTVFRGLGELEEGTRMYVQFENVQYEYEIKKTWITDAKDRTVIVEKEQPTLTLTTCYPFTFIGSAPDRYIIEAPLVEKTAMN